MRAKYDQTIVGDRICLSIVQDYNSNHFFFSLQNPRTSKASQPEPASKPVILNDLIDEEVHDKFLYRILYFFAWLIQRHAPVSIRNMASFNLSGISSTSSRRGSLPECLCYHFFISPLERVNQRTIRGHKCRLVLNCWATLSSFTLAHLECFCRALWRVRPLLGPVRQQAGSPIGRSLVARIGLTGPHFAARRPMIVSIRPSSLYQMHTSSMLNTCL